MGWLGYRKEELRTNDNNKVNHHHHEGKSRSICLLTSLRCGTCYCVREEKVISSFVRFLVDSIKREGQASQKVSAIVLPMPEKQTYIRTHIHTQVIIDVAALVMLVLVVVVLVLVVVVSFSFSFACIYLRSEKDDGKRNMFVLILFYFFLLFSSPSQFWQVRWRRVLCRCGSMKSDLLAIRRARMLAHSTCSSYTVSIRWFWLEKAKQGKMHTDKQQSTSYDERVLIVLYLQRKREREICRHTWNRKSTLVEQIDLPFTRH